jgi:hypothetical protein
MGTRFHRKRLWIKPAFQRRVLLHMGSYFLLYLLVIGLMGFFLFIQESLLNKQGKAGASLYLTYLGSLRPLLFATVLLAPYFIYDMIKFSNRIAGPLYRCQNMMRDMAEGKRVPEFLPRGRDLMPEFFADFNLLIRVYNNTLPAEENAVSPSTQLQETPAPAQLQETPAQHV